LKLPENDIKKKVFITKETPRRRSLRGNGFSDFFAMKINIKVRKRSKKLSNKGRIA